MTRDQGLHAKGFPIYSLRTKSVPSKHSLCVLFLISRTNKSEGKDNELHDDYGKTKVEIKSIKHF